MGDFALALGCFIFIGKEITFTIGSWIIAILERLEGGISSRWKQFFLFFLLGSTHDEPKRKVCHPRIAIPDEFSAMHHTKFEEQDLFYSYEISIIHFVLPGLSLSIKSFSCWSRWIIWKNVQTRSDWNGTRTSLTQTNSSFDLPRLFHWLIEKDVQENHWYH